MTLLEVIGYGVLAWIVLCVVVIWPLVRTAAKSDTESERLWREDQQKRWRARKKKRRG